MKQIQMSIKYNYLSDSYIPKFIKYDDVVSLDIENTDDLDTFVEFVSTYVHSYYEYVDNIRTEATFKRSYGVILDFDNKQGHNDSTILEFQKSEFAKKYNWILYTSKSHISDVQDCFHVFIPFDVPVDTVTDLKSAYYKIFDELDTCNIKCDTQVHDGARLIYPSVKLYDIDFDFYIESYFLGEYYKYTQTSVNVPIPALIVKTHELTDNNLDIDDIDNKYLTVFNTMSKTAQYSYIKSVMRYLNSKNRNNGYNLINYNMWIGIGFSLYRQFGYSNGIKLFKILSDGYPGDTSQFIEQQYNYLSGDNNNTAVNLDIIIKISSKMGFKHSMYFKYYFMSKHTFSYKVSLMYYTRMQRYLMNKYNLDEFNYNDVKIYNYSDKKNTRCFLLEARNDEKYIHITVRLGEMMDIMSELLSVDREFITSSVTRGIIRRFININGVYNMQLYARNKIIDSVDSTYIRVSDINNIMSRIRSYTPTTIHRMLTNSHMQQYLQSIGFLLFKKKRRVGKKTYMMFKVDLTKSYNDSFIFIEEELDIRVKFYTFSLIENNFVDMHTSVMRC